MQAETGSVHRFPVLDLAEPYNADADGIDLSPRRLAVNRVVGFEQLNERAQPYIAMRAQLLRHAEQTGTRIFAVTSAQPGNGKTHVAVNLAAALSRITPTLLVELDLRRPSIAARLGLPRPDSGIDDFLSGEARGADVGVRVQGYDLRIYPARLPRSNAEELIGSSRLGILFDALRAAPERPICIVDTPPITIDDDFMRIAPATDGLLMVVEEGRTPRRALLDALRRVQPTPIVGTVLNKSIGARGARIDYDYYRDQTPPPGWFGKMRAMFGRRIR